MLLLVGKRTAIAVLVAIGVFIPTGAAYANESAENLNSSSASSEEPSFSPEEAQFLDQLQEIVAEGQPSSFVPLNSAGQGATTFGSGTDPYGCTLYPSVVHLRQSGSYKTVGAKPYTNCTIAAPNQINHSSTLYIVEWGGTVLKPMMTKSNWATNTYSLTLKSLEWSCVNSKSSTFVQKTSGSVRIGSTNYYSSVSTPYAGLACGY